MAAHQLPVMTTFVQFEDTDPANDLVALLKSGDATTAQLIETQNYAALLEKIAPLLAPLAQVAGWRFLFCLCVLSLELFFAAQCLNTFSFSSNLSFSLLRRVRTRVQFVSCRVRALEQPTTTGCCPCCSCRSLHSHRQSC